MLLAVAWIISPFILIPLLISALEKKKKMSDFLLSLFKAGRIGADEYNFLRINTAFGAGAVRPTVPITPIAPVYPQYTPYPANGYAPCAKPQKKHEINSTNALLIIGVVFIIFAGMIFSTAVWLYISDLERTGIIALASCFFFAVSLLSHRKLKLENTGMAFYMLGSVFAAGSAAAAGYFGLFGNWLSFDGDGSLLLLAIVFVVVTVFSALGVNFYAKNVFVHAVLYSGLISLTSLCAQLADGYDLTVLVMNIIIAAALLFLHLGKLDFSELFDRPFRIFMTVSTSLFFALSLPCILDFSRLNAVAYVMTSIFAAQAAFYGISRKNSLLKGLLIVLGVILSVRISADIKVDEFLYTFVIFAVCALALAAVFRFVKQIRTPLSDILFQLTAFVSTICLMFGTDEQFFGYAAVIFLVQTAFMTFLALEDGGKHLVVMRLFAPLPFVLSAWGAAKFFGAEFECEAICFLLLAFASLVFSFNSESGRKFAVMHFSTAFYAGISLAVTLGFCETVAGYVLTIALCAALFAVCMTAKNNLISFVPTVLIYPAALNLADLLFKAEDTQFIMKAEFVTAAVIFAVLCAVSRTLFRERILCSQGSFVLDVPAVCMIIAPAFMLFEDTDEYRSFFAVICFGLFVLNFCRRANAKNVNSTLMSAASAVICSAIYIQPFFRIEDEILRHKFNLIPLLLFAFSIRMIWRGKSKAAREVGFAVNVLAFACLIWDALYFDDVFNTLCVLSASLVLLMWSYAMKKKRWFGISLCALVGVTVYAMRDYFGLLDWWVYLLLVGILLIFVAAMNEYFKSKGESVKTKAGKFFDEWKNWD